MYEEKCPAMPRFILPALGASCNWIPVAWDYEEIEFLQAGVLMCLRWTALAGACSVGGMLGNKVPNLSVRFIRADSKLSIYF